MTDRSRATDRRPAAARANNLLALGSAAVMTVYGAGFARTQAAAQRLEEGSDARRRPAPSTGAPAGSAATAGRHDENGVIAAPRDSVASAPLSAPLSAAPSAAATASSPVSPDQAVPRPSSATLTSAAASGSASTTAPVSSAPAPTASVAPSTPPAPAASPSSSPSAPVTPTSPATSPPSPASPAPASPAPASPAQSADSAKSVGWKDGTYTGWGTSRHGDIEATVVIENGKITGAIISRCLTRYSCSWVAHLQAQVVTRQSPEVDNVSGATQSANAFYYAVVEALSKAK